MSIYVYLVCLDHNPPLVAGDESGQHLYDLPQIRKDIADRDMIVAAVKADVFDGSNYFRNHTARFLAAHPTCRIGIRDEYGTEYPITEPDPKEE